MCGVNPGGPEVSNGIALRPPCSVDSGGPDVSVYLVNVLGVHTAAALIRMQCSFRGPCNALNMHSTSFGMDNSLEI